MHTYLSLYHIISCLSIIIVLSIRDASPEDTVRRRLRWVAAAQAQLAWRRRGRRGGGRGGRRRGRREAAAGALVHALHRPEDVRRAADLAGGCGASEVHK